MLELCIILSINMFLILRKVDKLEDEFIRNRVMLIGLIMSLKDKGIINIGKEDENED